MFEIYLKTREKATRRFVLFTSELPRSRTDDGSDDGAEEVIDQWSRRVPASSSRLLFVYFACMRKCSWRVLIVVLYIHTHTHTLVHMYHTPLHCQPSVRVGAGQSACSAHSRLLLLHVPSALQIIYIYIKSIQELKKNNMNIHWAKNDWMNCILTVEEFVSYVNKYWILQIFCCTVHHFAICRSDDAALFGCCCFCLRQKKRHRVSLKVKIKWRLNVWFLTLQCIVPCFVYSFYTDSSLHFEDFLWYKEILEK